MQKKLKYPNATTKAHMDCEAARFLGVYQPPIFLDEYDAINPKLLGAMLSLVGPVSSGKSKIIRKMAKKLGKKLVIIQTPSIQWDDMSGIPYMDPVENRLSRRGAARRLQRQGGRAPRAANQGAK